MDSRELPQELPDPLYPNETPYFPDSIEPDSPGSIEPEPSERPEPNDE